MADGSAVSVPTGTSRVAALLEEPDTTYTKRSITSIYLQMQAEKSNESWALSDREVVSDLRSSLRLAAVASRRASQEHKALLLEWCEKLQTSAWSTVGVVQDLSAAQVAVFPPGTFDAPGGTTLEGCGVVDLHSAKDTTVAQHVRVCAADGTELFTVVPYFRYHHDASFEGVCVRVSWVREASEPWVPSPGMFARGFVCEDVLWGRSVRVGPVELSVSLGSASLGGVSLGSVHPVAHGDMIATILNDARQAPRVESDAATAALQRWDAYLALPVEDVVIALLRLDKRLAERFLPRDAIGVVHAARLVRDMVLSGTVRECDCDDLELGVAFLQASPPGIAASGCARVSVPVARPAAVPFTARSFRDLYLGVRLGLTCGSDSDADDAMDDLRSSLRLAAEASRGATSDVSALLAEWCDELAAAASCTVGAVQDLTASVFLFEPGLLTATEAPTLAGSGSVDVCVLTGLEHVRVCAADGTEIFVLVPQAGFMGAQLRVSWVHEGSEPWVPEPGIFVGGYLSTTVKLDQTVRTGPVELSLLLGGVVPDASDNATTTVLNDVRQAPRVESAVAATTLEKWMACVTMRPSQAVGRLSRPNQKTIRSMTPKDAYGLYHAAKLVHHMVVRGADCEPDRDDLELGVAFMQADTE